MTTQPYLLVVMGVSGCGKSTLASLLARAINAVLIEADDYHSAAAKARMASGKPLTDELRQPWLKRLCQAAEVAYHQGNAVVMACSALRLAYREQFRALPFPCRFVYLQGEQELISQRLDQREGHFVGAGLLQSQFDTLESPTGEPGVITLDTHLSQEQLLQQALAQLSKGSL